MYCVACSRHRPTRYARFTKVVGLVVAVESKRIEGELCDPCMERVEAEYSDATWETGWFSVRAAMTCTFVVPANFAEERRIRRLERNPAEPTETDSRRARLRRESAGFAHSAVFWWTVFAYALLPLALLTSLVFQTSRDFEEACVVLPVVGLLLGVPTALAGAAALRQQISARSRLREAAAVTG